MNNEEKKENVIYKNSVEITGNISSISDIRTKSNGKQFLYISVAQNSRDGKASFYPIYLDGVMLEKFQKEGLKVGDRINAIGRMDSFQKDSKQTLQIRPFEINKVEYQRVRENTQNMTKDNSNEISM